MKTKNVVLFSVMAVLSVACGDKKDKKNAETAAEETEEVVEGNIQLSDLEKQLANLEASLKDAKSKRSDKKFDGIDSKISAKEVEIKALPEVISSKILDANSRLENSVASRDEAQRTLGSAKACSFTRDVTGKNTLCFYTNPFRLQTVEEANATVKSWEAELAKREAVVSGINSEIDALNKEFPESTAKLNNELSALKAVKSEASNLDKTIADLEAKIAESKKAKGKIIVE